MFDTNVSNKCIIFSANLIENSHGGCGEGGRGKVGVFLVLIVIQHDRIRLKK